MEGRGEVYAESFLSVVVGVCLQQDSGYVRPVGIVCDGSSAKSCSIVADKKLSRVDGRGGVPKVFGGYLLSINSAFSYLSTL